jgi:hypothetical protein
MRKRLVSTAIAGAFAASTLSTPTAIAASPASTAHHLAQTRSPVASTPMDWSSEGTYDSWADCVAAGNASSDEYPTWDCWPSGGASSGPPYDLMVFEEE